MVYEGVIYAANAKFTVAVEAATGKVLWRTPVNFDPASPRVVC
jgi:alcohol dehydrogenase (cytochrome c)